MAGWSDCCAEARYQVRYAAGEASAPLEVTGLGRVFQPGGLGAAVPNGLAVGVEVEPPLRRGSALRLF